MASVSFANFTPRKGHFFLKGVRRHFETSIFVLHITFKSQLNKLKFESWALISVIVWEEPHTDGVGAGGEAGHLRIGKSGTDEIDRFAAGPLTQDLNKLY